MSKVVRFRASVCLRRLGFGDLSLYPLLGSLHHKIVHSTVSGHSKHRWVFRGSEHLSAIGFWFRVSGQSGFPGLGFRV